MAALLIVSLTLGRDAPLLVPEHYGSGGQIDSWGSKSGVVTTAVAIGAAIFVVFAPAWPYDRIARASDRQSGGLSTRSKRRQAAYWLATPERAHRFRSIVSSAMRQFGALVVGLIAFALAQTLHDARVLSAEASVSDMPAWAFPVALTAFIAGMIVATVRLFLHLRTPPEWMTTLHRVSD